MFSIKMLGRENFLLGKYGFIKELSLEGELDGRLL